MSRRSFINILENVFQPTVNQGMRSDLLGTSPKVTTLTSETTLAINFSESASHEVTTGAQNLSAVTAVLGDLKDGERVLLKVTQGGTARTWGWSTGFAFAGGSGPVVTSGSTAVDLFEGIVSGGKIVLRIIAQNIS